MRKQEHLKEKEEIIQHREAHVVKNVLSIKEINLN